jgi:hypothetical protein
LNFKSISILLHGINENRLIDSIVSKDSLKKEFISEEFSEFITSNVVLGDVSIKTIKSEDSEEEGEIIQNKASVVYKQIDSKSTLKEVLRGSVVYEFPILYVSVE